MSDPSTPRGPYEGPVPDYTETAKTDLGRPEASPPNTPWSTPGQPAAWAGVTTADKTAAAPAHRNPAIVRLKLIGPRTHQHRLWRHRAAAGHERGERRL